MNQHPNLYLALDFETSSLDTETCEIIEIGYVLFTDKKVIETYSRLIKPSKPISDEIEKLTGITNAELDAFGLSLNSVIFAFLSDIFLNVRPCPSYIVAHNGTNFDRLIYKRIMNEYFKNQVVTSQEKDWVDKIINIPFIDSSTDIPYPKNITTRKLSYLGLEHGYINFSAHRASSDCLVCVHLCHYYGMDKIIEISNQKTVNIYAKPLPPWKDGGTQKTICKENGFRWNNNLSCWVKTIKEPELEINKILLLDNSIEIHQVEYL